MRELWKWHVLSALHQGDNRKSQRAKGGSAVIYSINGGRKRPPLYNPPPGRHTQAHTNTPHSTVKRTTIHLTLLVWISCFRCRNWIFRLQQCSLSDSDKRYCRKRTSLCASVMRQSCDVPRGMSVFVVGREVEECQESPQRMQGLSGQLSLYCIYVFCCLLLTFYYAHG